MSYLLRFWTKTGLTTAAAGSILLAGTPLWAAGCEPAISQVRQSATVHWTDPPAPPVSDPISYPDFANSADLAFNGTAATAAGKAPARRPVLRLTNGGFRQAGSAWSTTQINPRRSFTTTFDVLLHHASKASDGLAFVLQTAGVRALGGSGGGLGYRGRTPSVAIEFDTFFNHPDDPDGNHVAVVNNGHPETHLVAAPVPFPMFKTPFRAIVSYTASTHTLDVWAHPLSGQIAASPLISKVVDLGAVLGSDATYVGFTAATGDLPAVQDILNWSLSVPAA